MTKQAAAGQDELFPVWRHHAVFTDSPFVVQAEKDHRGHAVIEQVFADWTDGPLADLPSGKVRRQRRQAGHRRHDAQPAPRIRRPGHLPRAGTARPNG